MTLQKTLTQLIKSVKNFLEQVLSLDLRSLALLRVGVGTLVLTELILYARDLPAFFTDRGIFPHKIALERLAPWSFSIHALNGSWQFETLLFAIAGILAVMIIVGYKTRIATILSWILLVSLQNRTPLIGAGDDVLLRMLLFWGMFLPWNSMYSIDAFRNRYKIPASYSFFSFATAAYVLQIVFVYWFAFLLKTGSQWRIDGTAVYYALSIEQMVTPLGHFLVQYHELLTVLTFSTLALEGLAPFTFFVFWKKGIVRMFGVMLLMGMHSGFTMCLYLGPFSFISITALSALLPAFFWETFFSLITTKKRANLIIYYDNFCGFCNNSVIGIRMFLLLPQVKLLPAQEYPSVYANMQKHNSWVIEDYQKKWYFSYEGFIAIAKASPLLFIFVPFFTIPVVKIFGEKVYRFAAMRHSQACSLTNHTKTSFSTIPNLIFVEKIFLYFFVVVIFLLNMSTLNNSPIHLPQFIYNISNFTQVEQNWGMFAPFPFTDDGWYIIPGQLANGTKVDLFRNGKAVTYTQPETIANLYKNYRWRKLGEQLYIRNNYEERSLYAQYLCQDWNTTHTGSYHLQSLSIQYMLKRNLPDYTVAPLQQINFLDFTCPQ